MYEFHVLLRGVAIGLLLLLLLYVLWRYRALYAGRMLAVLILCLVGYLLAPLLWESGLPVRYVVLLLADSVPLVFLWFALAVFEEHQRPPPWTIVLGLAYVALSLVRVELDPGPANQWLAQGLFFIPQLVKLALLMGALGVVGRHWRSDLVQQRRVLRGVLLPITCAYMVIVVLTELWLGETAAPLWLEALHSLGVALLTLVFTATFLGMDEREWLPREPRDADARVSLGAAERAELETLQQAMDTERLYRDMALTIRSLSDTLGVPEHRLRQLINGALGYRNFNDYLNRYRVAETAARLRDPANGRLPILTIAMDAGYRSMTTFNKAFKLIEGMTPREYRQKTDTKGEISG